MSRKAHSRCPKAVDASSHAGYKGRLQLQDKTLETHMTSDQLSTITVDGVPRVYWIAH